MRRGKGLTKEQEELRQRGLRLLARMIARRHLASLAHDDRARPFSDYVSLHASGGGFPAVEEGEHAG